MQTSLILDFTELENPPEILCAACAGQGKEVKADLFLALGIGEVVGQIETAMYVPFCYDHVETARERRPANHMVNDMPDLLI